VAAQDDIEVGQDLGAALLVERRDGRHRLVVGEDALAVGGVHERHVLRRHRLDARVAVEPVDAARAVAIRVLHRLPHRLHQGVGVIGPPRPVALVELQDADDDPAARPHDAVKLVGRARAVEPVPRIAAHRAVDGGIGERQRLGAARQRAL
jgi:hypothetical protein